MAGYGFRLYTVKLVAESQKSKAIPFDECGMDGDEHVSVWIRRALTLLEKYEPLTGPPHLTHAVDDDNLPEISSYVVDPKRGDYCTKFLRHTDSPSTRIVFAFEYGRAGKVSVGVRHGGSMPLGHIATGDVYRAVLYLPSEGTKGLLALEAVPSAPNPQRMLNAWLARAGIDLRDEDAAEVEGDEDSEASPKPFKLNFRQYPNTARLERAVANNPAARMVLKQEKIDGAGQSSTEEVTVTAGIAQGKRKSAGTLAGRLLRGKLNQLADDEEPVDIEEMEELLEGSLEGFDWTDAYFQIDDASGKKRVGLERIDKYFVYPIDSGSQVTDKKFEQAVHKEAVGLQSTLGIDLG